MDGINIALLLGQLCLGVCEYQGKKNPPLTAAPFCDVMARARMPDGFRWSANDTRQTKEQADAINAAGKELCGWHKKKK